MWPKAGGAAECAVTIIPPCTPLPAVLSPGVSARREPLTNTRRLPRCGCGPATRVLLFVPFGKAALQGLQGEATAGRLRCGVLRTRVLLETRSLGPCMGCSTLSCHPALLPRDAVPPSATALHQGACLCPPAFGLLTCLHCPEERAVSGPLSLENSRFSSPRAFLNYALPYFSF